MAAASTSTPRVNIAVEPTTPADLPSLAECELLAFSGVPAPSSSPTRTISAPEAPFLELKNPFRAPLVRAGVHPRHWPDFDSTIRKRAADLRKGGVFFTAFVDTDFGSDSVAGAHGGGRRAVGYVKLMPPNSVLSEHRAKRKFKERVMGDVVRPAVERLREKIWKDADGQDPGAVAAFKKAQGEVLKRHPEAEECFILHIMIVHQSYQRLGVGTALLARAIEHANAAQRSLFIRDASPAGFLLYTKYGFKQVDAVSFTYKGVHVEQPSLIRDYHGDDARATDDGWNEKAEVSKGEAGSTGEKALMSPKSDDDAVLVSPGMEARSDGSEDFINVIASP